ncbi:hypothetical protein [Vibrio sp. WXL210]|uniref:hypothetical protein n=1 Tax=Vibrio sp. WXL210 TaxID=3450709 RepID=UPI003EC55A8D
MNTNNKTFTLTALALLLSGCGGSDGGSGGGEAAGTWNTTNMLAVGYEPVSGVAKNTKRGSRDCSTLLRAVPDLDDQEDNTDLEYIYTADTDYGACEIKSRAVLKNELILVGDFAGLHLTNNPRPQHCGVIMVPLNKEDAVPTCLTPNGSSGLLISEPFVSTDRSTVYFASHDYKPDGDGWLNTASITSWRNGYDAVKKVGSVTTRIGNYTSETMNRYWTPDGKNFLYELLQERTGTYKLSYLTAEHGNIADLDNQLTELGVEQDEVFRNSGLIEGSIESLSNDDYESSQLLTSTTRGDGAKLSMSFNEDGIQFGSNGTELNVWRDTTDATDAIRDDEGNVIGFFKSVDKPLGSLYKVKSDGAHTDLLTSIPSTPFGEIGGAFKHYSIKHGWYYFPANFLSSSSSDTPFFTYYKVKEGTLNDRNLMEEATNLLSFIPLGVQIANIEYETGLMFLFHGYNIGEKELLFFNTNTEQLELNPPENKSTVDELEPVISQEI